LKKIFLLREANLKLLELEVEKKIDLPAAESSEHCRGFPSGKICQLPPLGKKEGKVFFIPFCQNCLREKQQAAAKKPRPNRAKKIKKSINKPKSRNHLNKKGEVAKMTF
jgi:hypothetical protein